MKSRSIFLFCISLNIFCLQKNKHKEGYMLFNQNIVELCRKNTFFRKEVVTGPHSQVVLMSIPRGQDIGEEVHDVDQTLVFVQGHGRAITNGTTSEIYANHLIFVPAGMKHNVENIGSEDLKLYTIYAPVEHPVGTIEKTKPNSKH